MQVAAFFFLQPGLLGRGMPFSAFAALVPDDFEY